LRLRAPKKIQKQFSSLNFRRSTILKFKFQPTESKLASDSKQKLEMDPSDSNLESLATAFADGSREGEGQAAGDPLGFLFGVDPQMPTCAVPDPPVHPYRSFRRRRGRSKDEQLSQREMAKMLRDYLKKAEPYCRVWSKSGDESFSKCSCIAWLASNESKNERGSVGAYMLYFYLQEKIRKQEILMDWIRYTEQLEQGSCVFLLPFITNPALNTSVGEEGEAYRDKMIALRRRRVCKRALGFILGFTKHTWQTCAKAVATNTIPHHGNKGLRSGIGKQFDSKFKNSLLVYMERIKDLAEPRSTVAVRDRVGIHNGKTVLKGLKEDDDDDDDIVYLPPYMTKRGIYEEFCREQGWRLQSTNNGYSPTKLREDAEEYPSWFGFLEFWKSWFKTLKIGKPMEDVCTDCHLYANRFKFAANREANNRDDSDEEDKIDAAAIDGGGVEDPTTGKKIDMLLEKDSNDVELDACLKEAHLHVKQADLQRLFCNNKIQKAEDDFKAGRAHSRSTRTIVVDYSQNISVPQVGLEQPGRTYFLSPLSVYVFGIVNCAQQGGTLDAYIYGEGKGKKGGNNVASLIMKFLEQQGWLKDPSSDGFEMGYELNIIMDNCQVR
jgi:hypothetical protein